MLIDSFLIQPLKKSPHFPLCVPGFCAKCRTTKPDKTEEGQNDIGSAAAAYVVENQVVVGMDTLPEEKESGHE